MREKLIYFDNAATTIPKPPTVAEAVKNCVERRGGNPGRGSHPLAQRASDTIYSCREEAAALFNCEPERVAFTYSATYALNMAIKGLIRPGGHILISGMSHNAAYRPVVALAKNNDVSFDVYPRRPGDTDEDILRGIEERLKPETQLIVSTHMSNVASETEPVERIGELCRSRGVRLIVDGAQSAGHLPLDMKKMNITALCLPGHKGLYGIQGVGMLLCGDGEDDYATVIEGGSGIHSLDAAMPEALPERFEAGTPGTPAIAGLLAGISWVRREGTETLRARCAALSSFLWNELSSDPFFTVYGAGDGGVLSFNVKNHSPSDVSEYLAKRGICVRSGYHCAPLAHRSVGSFENGSVRVSFSPMNARKEVKFLLDCLNELKKS